MARTTRRQIVHPYYQPPQPPNDPRPTPLVRGSGRPPCFASPNEETTAMPIDEDSLILLPREYNGDDDDEDEYWRDQSSAQSLFKTCIAYEQISEDSPRIVRYVRQQNFPNLASDLMGDMARKCWMQDYGSVAELRSDVESFLVSKDYEVEGDKLKDFDPANIP